MSYELRTWVPIHYMYTLYVYGVRVTYAGLMCAWFWSVNDMANFPYAFSAYNNTWTWHFQMRQLFFPHCSVLKCFLISNHFLSLFFALIFKDFFFFAVVNKRKQVLATIIFIYCIYFNNLSTVIFKAIHHALCVYFTPTDSNVMPLLYGLLISRLIYSNVFETVPSSAAQLNYLHFAYSLGQRVLNGLCERVPNASQSFYNLCN